ncbi:MAG: DNA replication/repair protein RecF [Clostridia bacterium]|nr:DNA replication/repair protein RecF [Clostridia bacterium]
MILKSFKATSFRNISSCEIEFSEGVNALLGENAQGKTNAIEGIYIFARGRSFRRGDERDLIKFGEEGFRTEIEYRDKMGDNLLEYSVYGKERRRRKNGYKLKGASELVGSFRAVLFVPDDLNLVKGGPDERREFLNVSISQYYPSYIGLYRSFKSALENRNAILKCAMKGHFYDENELASWSEVLSEYASHIYIMRRDFIKKLSKYAREELLLISSGCEELSLSYKSSFDEEEKDAGRERIKELYLELYKNNITRETSAGVTLFGPHRDDILIKLNEKEARSFASQGQQRSIVLAIKLAEGEVGYELSGEYPVYLLDDVLSELDCERQKFFLSKRENRQIIISGCDMRIADFKPDKIIEVKRGFFS